MSAVRLDAAWCKFGKCREFALIGSDAIATVSGIYACFYDRRSGQTRVERFDGGERGDGADCIAGHSVAPVFSVVERRANPRISIFAYPTTRRVARCVDSHRASGYLCCAFAGTEYLLGQTTFPDFRLVVWHWRTGERLTEIGWPAAATLNVAVEGSRLACSVDFSQLVARHAASSATLSVYRLLACSGTVILLPVETRFDRRPVSCCWSLDGLLLCCDEAGNAWSVDLDETEDRRARTIVERSAVSGGRPLLVAHDEGAVIVDRPSAAGNGDARATFYRKSPRDRKEKWSAAWTMLLPCSPRQVESDPRETRIFFLGENGDLYEMSGPSADDPPRVELLLRGGEPRYAAIFPLRESYFAGLDRDDRLSIIDASTGSRVSSKLLGHHGKVTGAASHPALPILASCSRTGNCLLVDATAPSSLRIARCVHLQREAVDRAKFSRGGRLLGVAASQAGRLFVLSLGVSERGPALNAKVAAWMNVGRKVVDFVVRETDESGTARAVVLLGAGPKDDPRMGNEMAVYSCRLSGDYRETGIDRTARLPAAFGALHEGREDGSEMIGVPYRSKQLHRIALEEKLGEARLVEVLPSLHQIAGIEMSVDHGDSSLLTHGFDGLIVWRERDEPRRVLAVIVAHHRAEGGVRSAILVADAIVSLGRNGDLVCNRLIGRRGPRSTGLARRIPERLATGDGETADAREESSEAGTWMDEADRRRALAGSGTALASRLSILDDWAELKRRVQVLLDSNEKEPMQARLPVSVFDLDRESRERRTLAARAEEIASTREIELRIAVQDRASSYLRERFSDPLIVRPRIVRSFFGSAKVANYPLTKQEPRSDDYHAWCRFSVATRAMVSRLEGEAKNRPWDGSRRGFLEMLEACAVAEHWERESKARFNELIEEMRSARRSAIRVAMARATEARRLVDQLKRTFGGDASSSLLEAPRTWGHPAEESEEDSLAEAEAEAVAEAETDPGRREKMLPMDDGAASDDRDDFHREALRRMMDGVLEVSLETRALRSVPRPGCLLRKDATAYTEDDVRKVETYERRIRERQADRQKYRSMLEAEIERIEGDLSRDTGAFDEALGELSMEKLRVERSILARRLSRMQEVLGHRTIVRGGREIRREIETGLEPAVEEGRLLDEKTELFEAGLAELRSRYETARRRDKLLEGKYRADLSEVKPSTMETLIRHYRRRPTASRVLEGTSVAFLSELAACVLRNRSSSDALPREYSDYLRALDDLDAAPDSLSFKSEPNQWRTACRLRRLKVEAEIKVRIQAIELAEAEQSLACLRNASIAARAAITRRKEAVKRLEQAATSGLEDDRDIALPLKAGQLCVRIEGCPRSDCGNAVLIPRSEICRATQAIREAEARRSLARRKLADVRRVVSVQECHHARAAATMTELRERAEDIERLKVSRIVRACRETFKAGASRAEEAEAVRVAKLDDLEPERRRRRIATETRIWRQRNAVSAEAVARSEAERNELIAATRDPLRARVVAFRGRRIETTMREARLARRARDAYSELSILRSRLQASKLRTYPTLTSKFL